MMFRRRKHEPQPERVYELPEGWEIVEVVNGVGVKAYAPRRLSDSPYAGFPHRTGLMNEHVAFTAYPWFGHPDVKSATQDAYLTEWSLRQDLALVWEVAE